MSTPRSEEETQVFGVHAVSELLLTEPKRIRHLMIVPSSSHKALRRLAHLAKEAGVMLRRTPRRQLDRHAPEKVHQGVIAIVDPLRYLELHELLARLASLSSPLLVLLDEVEDPHNLGAIIRSAHALGAHGLIIPTRRAAQVSGTVAKAAAGALAHLPIARVTNLATTIAALNDAGYRTIATVTDAGSLPWELDLSSGPLAIVVGGEHKGVRRLVKERCGYRLSIPLAERSQSLNASVAAALALYEVMRARST